MVFGARSTQIPKIFGKRTINRLDGQPPAPPSVGFENIDGDFMGVGPMNQMQNIAQWLRNSYKQRAYQIRDALIAHGNLESSFPVAGWPLSPPPDDNEDDDYEDEDEEDEDEEDEDNEEVPFCSRYDEIKSYLINQKRELAIDTMKFRMPEHTLHQYIRRNGGIDLSADEWREFLLNCTERKELFQIRQKNGKLPTPYHAILRMLSTGWSTNLAAPDTPVQVNISRAQAECFFNASVIYLTDRKEPWYRLDFWDADVEIFRTLCNNWLVANNRGDPLPKDIFEACIHARVQPRFVLGPKGIVRKLPGPPPKATASRKRQAKGLQPGPPSKHRSQNRLT
ncbi:hypothetical protein sscle_01g004130 [Sclerotinia sclerotiorum 1980 UF-70]|nr:hypothetical protein sscle_01g004130 [Sclerotinia sclerotiorum 1980 UF-70]